MRRSVKCLLLLTILAGLSGTALADVSPNVEVRLTSPFIALKAGDTYEGSLEIHCLEPGTISQLAIDSEGWTASLQQSPASKAMAAGEKITVQFTARALDPDQRLEFSCDFQGYTVRHGMDFSERNVRNMTEGAPVKEARIIGADSGDRSWDETDRILGIEQTVIQDASRRTITVSGRFGCNLDGGGYLPAHSITVEVWDQDTGVDDLMATGSTNYDGYYSITVDSNDGDITSDPDIYVKFILVNSRMRVYEPTSGDNYVYSTGVTTNYSGSNLELGSLIPADPDLQASVFQHTNGTRAWVRDVNLGYDVPAARIEWPSAAWPNCSGDGRIQMRVDFSWNDGTIWHEYGHWFDHEMASWEPFNYCNGVCDASPTDCGHCFWCEESQTIAWLEGWAQFHGYAVSSWVPGYYGYTPLSGINAENIFQCSGSWDPALLTEGFVAALAQDIADNTQDSHGAFGSYTDALATGVGTIYAVNVLDNPTGSQDFANKYVARYPSYRENFWETSANCGFWFDTTVPGSVTALTSTSHTSGVSSPDPTVSFTWNRAYDNYSGIQGYGVHISSSPTLPPATMDIEDVTSYTTAALSPGTYYFSIRARDNAGYWSNSYQWWGPIVIRDPDPADLTSYLAAGWDYPLVPRTDNDSTTGFAPVAPSLPGDAALTYWNIFGQNIGEAATGSGHYGWLNIDGEYTGGAYWGAINAGGLFYGPNRGPVYVQAGRHSFTCRYDATDLVAEENELNNDFGRQFAWTPSPILNDQLVTRATPPPSTGGWDQVTSGLTYYNCDGLAMPTTTNYWHAMAVWAVDDANDFDARLHETSPSAEEGFATSLAYSANGYGNLDAVIVNRNTVGGSSWDIGVPSWYGSGDYRAYHASSQIIAFGDSVTVAMSANQPILLREVYINTANHGPLSVTASGDPADGPLRLVVLNRDFEQGTLTAGSQIGSAWTDENGFARVNGEISVTGWYGIVVYRNQSDGLDARDVTIEVGITPPDLATWAPDEWHSAITPRAALDGTPTVCPEPTMLYSTPDATYLNVATTNLGPVDSPIPTRAFHDDTYLGYVNWGTVGAGGTRTYNWDHPFEFNPGRHTLSFRVDGLNEIEETNEDNNIHGEQWIWSSYEMVPPMAELRSAPPVSTAGWDDISSGEPVWYNCDGLRLEGNTTGFWKSVAILPAAGSDFDLRLHEPSTGAKDGFGTSLGGSYEAGTLTEYVLVDQNTVAKQDYDVGVLRWSGGGNYRVQAEASTYIGNSPIGTWGPYEVPADGLVSMVEFHMVPATYGVTLENLSSADLGLAVHQEGIAYQNRYGAIAGANEEGAAMDEVVNFEVSEELYHCIVVYRNDQGTGPAPYRLVINNGLSAVENGGLPEMTRLAGAFPNPFNPQTKVAFDLSRADHARVVIYDVQGRLVRRLVDEDLPAGRHSVVWMGRDDNGQGVASGVYFARLEAASGQGITKLVLVK